MKVHVNLDEVGPMDRPGSARTVMFEGRLPSCRLPWIPRPAGCCDPKQYRIYYMFALYLCPHKQPFNTLKKYQYLRLSIPKWANCHLQRTPWSHRNGSRIPHVSPCLPRLVKMLIFEILAVKSRCLCGKSGLQKCRAAVAPWLWHRRKSPEIQSICWKKVAKKCHAVAFDATWC